MSRQTIRPRHLIAIGHLSVLTTMIMSRWFTWPLLTVICGAVAAASEAPFTDTFSAPLAAISDAGQVRFHRGSQLFRRNFAPRAILEDTGTGLGPLYNRESCSGCHVRDGRGRPPAPGSPWRSAVVMLGVAGQAHPVYGDQLQDKAVRGVAREGRPVLRHRPVEIDVGTGDAINLNAFVVDFEDLGYGPLGADVRWSIRVAPALIGLGLLEAVPRAVLEDLADPDDADGNGISGRINWVADPDGAPVVGRFGWKASRASLEDQVASALQRDIGIRNPLYPSEPCTPRQDLCGPDGALELTAAELADLVLYVRMLSPPTVRQVDDSTIRRGKALFADAGCAACHRPTLTTRSDAWPGPTIAAYTDLLLHDMGPDLADGLTAGQASGQEWRTAPLWGLGLVPKVNGHDRLLHDGRARGVLEAIMWHGGEAAAARRRVSMMTPSDRAALVLFVESL